MTSEGKEPARLRWWYTVALMAVYLGTFHIWKPFPWAGAAFFGIIVACGLMAGALDAHRRGYFVNKYDGFFHGVVILDIVLEGMLVPMHVGHGFLWCALAFVVVIGGYRIEAWREVRSPKGKKDEKTKQSETAPPLTNEKDKQSS